MRRQIYKYIVHFNEKLNYVDWIVIENHFRYKWKLLIHRNYVRHASQYPFGIQHDINSNKYLI